jgi:hypothetical protein
VFYSADLDLINTSNIVAQVTLQVTNAYAFHRLHTPLLPSAVPTGVRPPLIHTFSFMPSSVPAPEPPRLLEENLTAEPACSINS